MPYFGFFISCSFLLTFSYANDTLLDTPAPFFEVISADKKYLSLNETKGKVVVLFYESKDTIELNRKAKKALNDFYAKQKGPVKRDILRLGIIDCRGVFLKSAWEKGLRANSFKEGITIYGDWSGKMAIDYRLKRNQSNLLIIDKKGLVRYYAFGSIKGEDIAAAEKLLSSLIGKE